MQISRHIRCAITSCYRFVALLGGVPYLAHVKSEAREVQGSVREHLSKETGCQALYDVYRLFKLLKKVNLCRSSS
jgi:hypothetical protein